MSEDNVPKAFDEQSGASSFVEKTFSYFMFLPFTLAPFLAVLFPKALAFALPVCGVLGAGVLFFGLKQKPALLKGPLIYAACVLVLATASFFWAIYPDGVLERVAKLAPLILFSLLFMGVARAGRGFISLPCLMAGILAIASLSALLLSADILSNGYLYRLSRGALDAPLYSTAVYNKGSIVIMVMALCAYMLHPAGPTLKRALWLIPLALMLYVVQSQATQVGLALALLLYFAFPYKFRWAWIGAFIFVVMGFAFKPVIAPMAYDEFAQSVQNMGYMQQAYAAHRLEIWDYVSREIWSSPFIGHGIEFTRNFDGFDSAKVFLPEVNPMHPHSFILQTWLEFGVVGIALALSGIGILMKNIYMIEDIRIKRTAFSTLAVLTFMASITFGMWQGWWVVFILTVAALFIVAATPDTSTPQKHQG